MAEYIKETDSLNTGREKINEELTRSNNNANTAKIDSAVALLKAIASMDLSESVRNQLNQLIIEGDSSVEAAAARVDEKNVIHDTLKERIDDGFLGVTSQLNETNSQLAQTATKVDRIDRGYGGTFPTLAELQATYPSGNNQRYVVSEDGNWYYWNDLNWVSGGVFQSLGLADRVVSLDKLSTASSEFFDGNYVENAAVLEGIDVSVDRIGSLNNGVCAVIPISSGVYRIKKSTSSNRFRIVGMGETPVFYEDRADHLPADAVYNMDDTLDNIEINVGENIKYLVVYVSSSLEKPGLSVVEVRIDSKYLENGLLNKSNKNLYHGELSKGLISGSYTGVGGNYTVLGEAPNAKVCFIEILPNKTYTITPYGGDRTRYALFNSFPHLGDSSDLYLFSDDRNLSSFTFTNNSNGKYLMIYLSSTGEEVPCQVEEGNAATEYEPYYYINKNVLPIEHGKAQPDETSKLKITDEYSIFENLILDYKASPQVSVATGEEFDLWEATHDQIYLLFDDLMDSYPSYITKINWGTDDFGLPLNYYKFTPIKTGSGSSGTGNTTEIKRLKILLISGVHGNEHLWAYSYYRFLEDMCNKYRDNESLEFIRFNVDFIIIPVVNPSGWDDVTRSTRNGVNINRNFSHNWTFSDEDYNASGPAPFSEIETQFVKSVIDENSDASILIDSHTFRGGNNILWAPVNDLNTIDDITFLNDHMGYMTRYWAKKYEWFPQEEDRIVGHINSLNSATVASYGSEKGMHSFTMEMFENIPYKSSYKDHDSTSIEFAMEYLGNFIIGAIKAM